MRFEFEQYIDQLEPRKGAYFYLTVDAETVNQFPKKRSTRLVCEIDGKVKYSCGLNHLGDGNFFIILSKGRLQKLKKNLGDQVQFVIYEDPNPLGVEVPEVLQVLLTQDETAKATYETLTDGKKRSLIYSIIKVKNIDLQVEKTLNFLAKEREKKK